VGIGQRELPLPRRTRLVGGGAACRAGTRAGTCPVDGTTFVGREDEPVAAARRGRPQTRHPHTRHPIPGVGRRECASRGSVTQLSRVVGFDRSGGSVVLTMPGTENMLTLDCTTYAGCSVVRPRGTLDAGTYASLRDDLLKYAAEEPAAVLVELDALHIAREHVLSVFSLLWMRVSEWPGVPLGLLVRNGVRRENVRHTVVARYVPVYADLTEALDDQPQQPRRRRTYSVLPTTARASGNARRLVRETTRDWEIEA